MVVRFGFLFVGWLWGFCGGCCWVFLAFVLVFWCVLVWGFFSAMENFPGERISFGETFNVFLWCEIGLSTWDARLFPASL